MTMEEDPIVEQFIVESREHLADIENQLLAIEAAGADIDLDLVNTVFRAVHSIKGGSGFLDFSVLGELAHHMENLLNLVRNRELVPDSTSTDVLLRAADTLSAMVDDIHSSNEVDISGHVSELQQIVNGATGQAPAASPSTAEAKDETGAPNGSVEESSAESLQAPITDAAAPAGPRAATANAQPAASAAPTRSTPAKGDAGNPQRAACSATASPVDTSIRVSVRLLDSLMNLAGELVLSRNQLVQKVGSDRTLGLDSVAARLDQVTSELQEAIMQTRMQVVGTVFSKFPRVVRDLSRQLGKEC